MTTSPWDKTWSRESTTFDPLGGQPHHLTHIFAHRHVPRRLHGPRQLDALGRLHQVHDAAAHAARHPGDDCLDHSELLVCQFKVQGSKLKP